MHIGQERQKAICQTMATIRQIEVQQGVTRNALAAIQSVLLTLAAQVELFPREDFSPPSPVFKKSSFLFRLSEDEDHRYALYLNSSLGTYHTSVHSHNTWAVIVGMQGEELNKIYDFSEGTMTQSREFLVTTGTGIAFLPDDFHSIHISAEEAPLRNFHLYGLALEQLQGRRYYLPEKNTWHTAPTQKNIREARLRPFSS